LGEYEDIPGFCKSATIDDIRKHGYILTPGRYVGAEAQEDDGEPFEEKMKRLVAEWRKHKNEAQRLDEAITKNLEELEFSSLITKPEYAKKTDDLLFSCVESLLKRLQLADLQIQTSPNKLVLLVARIKNIHFEIRPNDHNPPHFHVKINGGEYNASYSIDMLENLAGRLPNHLEREVLKWAKENQTLLMQTWDRMRPQIVVTETEDKANYE